MREVGNVIATVTMEPIKITDRIFETEEDKQLFLNSTDEQKEIFILDLCYDWDKFYKIELP